MSDVLPPFRGGEGDIYRGILSIPEYCPADVVRRLVKTGDMLASADLLRSSGTARLECSNLRLFHSLASEGDYVEPFIRREIPRINPSAYTLDYAVYSRMECGSYHQLHADNCTLDDKPNHTPQRKVVSILYLNDWDKDFQGGLVLLPKVRMCLTPKAGTLYVFPCGWEYQHEVEYVYSGTRQALIYWWK